MKTMLRITALLILVCFSTQLAALQSRPWMSVPSFDPTPRQPLSSLCPTRGMDSMLYQYYENGWVDSERMEAEYDGQGRIAVIYGYWAEVQPGPLELSYRTRFEYRDDGRPQHIYLEALDEGNWTLFSEVQYEYDNDLLQMMSVDYMLGGELRLYIQTMFVYWPTTNILQRVVEFTYSDFSPVPTITKYEITMDAGSRPSEIVISGIGNDMDQWYTSERRTYVYHNDDQTTHASYMQQMEFSWPIYAPFFIGVQPSKLLEERIYCRDVNDEYWIEQSLNQYQYGDDNQLDTVDYYDRKIPYDPEIWIMTQRKEYTYQEGYPITETTYQLSPGDTELTPQYRIHLGYQEITAAEDPVIPEVIGSLGLYPNPFNQSAGVSFRLEEASQAEMAVYNLKGQKVRTLLDGFTTPGIHQTVWDGRDAEGNKLAAGIYIIRLTAGPETRTVKAILAK